MNRGREHRLVAHHVMWSAGFTLLLLALVLGAVGCGSSSSDGGAGTTVTTGADSAQAADFSGVTLDGVDVSLSEYRGKPLVLAFIASW